jgi:hypothetical protein
MFHLARLWLAHCRKNPSPGPRNLGRHSAHFYGKQEAHGSDLKITVTNERFVLSGNNFAGCRDEWEERRSKIGMQAME